MTFFEWLSAVIVGAACGWLFVFALFKLVLKALERGKRRRINDGKCRW